MGAGGLLLSSLEMFLHEPPHFVQLAVQLPKYLMPLPFGTFDAFTKFTILLASLPSFDMFQAIRQFVALPLNILQPPGQLISLPLKSHQLSMEFLPLTFHPLLPHALKLLSQFVAFPMHTLEFLRHLVAFLPGTLELLDQVAVLPLNLLPPNPFEFPSHFIPVALNFLKFF